MFIPQCELYNFYHNYFVVLTYIYFVDVQREIPKWSTPRGSTNPMIIETLVISESVEHI